MTNIDKIHREIMWYTQSFRMKQETAPKIWISRALFEAIVTSVLGDHLTERIYGYTYFGCEVEVVEEWEGIRYIVGFEGGNE